MDEKMKEILKNNLVHVPAEGMLLIRYPEATQNEDIEGLHMMVTDTMREMDKPIPFLLLPDVCKISVIAQEDAEIQKREPPTFLGVPMPCDDEFPSMKKCKPCTDNLEASAESALTKEEVKGKPLNGSSD